MTDRSSPVPPEPVAALQAQLKAQQQRIDKLEQVAIGAYCAFVAGILIAGTLLPFVAPDPGEDEGSVSVLNAIFAEEITSDLEPLRVAFTIGFIGLLLVIGALLVSVLPAAARRDLIGRRRTFAAVFVTLGVIGSLIVILLSLITLGRDGIGVRPGAGGWVLLAGMIGAGALLSAPVHDWVRPATR